MSEEGFVDTSKVFLREIPKSVAKDIIVKNHYTHAWSKCSAAIGIFYRTVSEQDSFFEGDQEKLIGCLVYGAPVGRRTATSISELLKPTEILELVRLWIADGYGKNIESYCISQSFKWLNEHRPEIKCLISYADGEQGHAGRIYQATGWIYQGNRFSIMDSWSLSLKGPPNYDWILSRTVSSIYGTHNHDVLKKIIGHTFWRKSECMKHRYVIFICGKHEKKKYIKTLKSPSLPYPKENDFTPIIKEITLDTADEPESFFVDEE